MSKIKFYKDAAKEHQVYPELDPEDITKFESLEDIENAFPNVSDEGSNMTLNHTVEAPMKLELAPSELKQKTTNGKNLLDNLQLTQPQTRNGITATPVFDSKGFLEYVNINGTATDSTTIAIAAFIPEIDTSYKVNGSPSNSTTSTAYVYVTGSITSYGGQDTSATWATTGSKSYQIIIQNGVTISNMKFYPMIRLATVTDSSYEPYTGGYPQPNPDFPSQIHSVSGDNEIIIENKNYFDINKVIDTWDDVRNVGIKHNSNDTLLVSTSSESSSILAFEPNKLSDYCPDLKVGDLVYLTGDSTGTSKQIYLSKSSYTWFFNQPRTITQNDLDSLVYWYASGRSTSAVISNIKIKKVDSSGEKSYPINLGDLEYCKFGDYTDEFIKNDGKNLFDKSKALVGKNWNGNSMTYSIVSDYVEAREEESYSVSVSNMGNYTSCVIVALDENKALLQSYNSEIAVYLPAGTKYIAISLRCSSSHTWTQSELDNAYIMLNEGVGALPYEPYGSGIWYLKKNIGKAQLLSTDYYEENSSGTITYRFRRTLSEPFVSQGEGVCNTNQFITSGISSDREAMMLYDAGGSLYIYYRINKTTIDNLSGGSAVAKFKTWLENNPTYFYSKLAASQYILLNDTLQHQLDDIYNWVESYPEQTNISQINNDLPFIISAHAMKDLSVIDKYPTENSEHLVESGGVYEVVNNLDVVQQEHTTQIEALERASLIYNALPKVTGSGTDLTLDNTAESPLTLDLSGNTSQETTTGKNKFNILSFVASHVLFVTLNEQLVDMKADTTTGAQFGINYVKNVDSSKTYTMSFKVKKTNYGQDASTGSVVVYMYGSNDDSNYELISSANVVFTPTLNQEYDISKQLTGYSYYRFYFYNATGSTVPLNCETQYYNIQFEEGSAATTWEKFTNGASPNPDYLQEIHTISGDNEIVVRNKNLFNLDWFTFRTNNGITATKGDGYVLLNGTATATAFINYTIPINLGTAVTNYWYVKSDSTGIMLKVKRAGQNDINITATAGTQLQQGVGNNISYQYNGYLQISNGITLNNCKVYIDVRNTYLSLSDYVFTPHEEQSLPLNLPVENLFDKDNISLGYIKEDGTLSSDSAYRTSDFIPIQQNTAYYKTLTQSPRTKYFDSNKQPLNTTTYQDIPIGGSAGTFTAPNNARYLRFSFPFTGSSAVDVNSIMLNKGTKANAYTSYGTIPLEYCKFGDYADEFYKATKSDTGLAAGKWYLKKNIGKDIFDENTNWPSLWTNTQGLGTISPATSLDVLSSNSSGLSNYFIYKWVYNNPTPCFYVYKEGSINRAMFVVPFTTKEDFISWVTNHNIVMYSKLATPQYILLNDTLQQQLEDISKAISYQTQTNISQANNDLPLNIDATAVLDLNTLVNAIVSLGGNI